ncbi:MAG: hypothetical protein IPP16_17505 [Acidimicrobiaceae bacterium]|nr:hypothetical protein [Acidimicrobiaceae bacterium]
MANSDHIGADEDISRVIGPGAGAEAFELAGWIAYYRRDLEAAHRLADEAVRLATSSDIRRRPTERTCRHCATCRPVSTADGR